MHEADKLAEAEYFLQQMIAVETDRMAHTYSFSAFLSASRSVLQRAFKEAEKKGVQETWYVKRVQSSPVVQFFRDIRNLSVHAKQVTPNREVQVQVEMHVLTGLQVDAYVIRDGKIVLEPKHDTPPLPQGLPPEPKEVNVTMFYKLNDWPGTEDVNTLCRKYLDELQDIIQDGQSKGYLTA